MKKIFLLGFALVAAMGIMNAQTEDEMFQARLQFHQRNVAQKHLDGKHELSSKVMTNDAKGNGVTMPENTWFPGEWEEVKAIVSTVYYNYYPVDHVGEQTWTADPLLGGYADIYRYSGGGWQEQGTGRYVGIPDTSNQAFSKVFYSVIDAVQMGGAESWVRVEKLADSAIVLRQLARLGMRHDNVRFIEGYGNSFWFRDCGPIAFYYGDNDSIGMVDFMYYPGRALDDSLPYYIEQQMGIMNIPTTIEWEGGNCLVDGAGLVISSDAIYGNNVNDTYGQLTWDGINPNTINYTQKQRLTRQQVDDSLAHIMGPRGVGILPTYKYDGGTGHIDLYADMIDENEFVFSIMPSHYSNWTDYKTFVKNADTMLNWKSVHGENFKNQSIPFPCTNNGGYFANQSSYNSNYTRTYSNHTFVNNVIIQPVFSNVVNGEPSAQWDKERFDSLRIAYPGYTLYPINVASFDGSGGAIHCITKQIPADSPIRILHKSITGRHGELSGSHSISATITNNHGIANAKLVYRIDGGSWNETTLAGNGNEYTGAMDLPTNVDQAKVEYYISATNNDGKTITKPMPAAQGGYFTFYVGNNITVGIDQQDEEMIGQFFPNPSNGAANIVMDVNGKCSIQVVDMMGRTVATDNVEGKMIYTINTRNFNNGLYHVVFTAEDGKKVVRKLYIY